MGVGRRGVRRGRWRRRWRRKTWRRRGRGVPRCVEELEGNELDIANFEHLVVDNREGIGRDPHGGQCRYSRC